MTLDEAITHAEEVAEKARNDADSGYYDEDKCLECANEHEQLAEWLKELKELRNTMETIKKRYILIEKSPRDGRNDLMIGKVIEWQRKQGDWIPVSERLPNRNGCYNVTRKLKEGETIYFISDVCYFDGQNTWHRDTGVNHGRPYLTDIIAWQPLPEPYEKGGAE